MTAVILTVSLALATTFAEPDRRIVTPGVSPSRAACSAAERREALRAMQTAVLAAVPDEIPSLRKAIQPGGSLAGRRLSHGYVVLAGAGGVALDDLQAQEPVPPLLIYAPAASSAPADWLDFDGPDDPYRLVGWGYFAPYAPGSSPPDRTCVSAGDWMVHEAGWHLKDGGMQLTAGAEAEPPRPAGLEVHMWHPRVWDLHVWRGADGVASIGFANPSARPGGFELPADSFFRPGDRTATPRAPRDH
jgi:hypothetical protein